MGSGNLRLPPKVHMKAVQRFEGKGFGQEMSRLLRLRARERCTVGFRDDVWSAKTGARRAGLG